MSYTCSCGSTVPHRIATRKTADERVVVFWSDGLITAAVGLCIAGIGPAREPWAEDADRTAQREFMGLVELLDFSEVARGWTALRKECRKVYQRQTSWRWSPDRGGPSPAEARRIVFSALTEAP